MGKNLKKISIWLQAGRIHTIPMAVLSWLVVFLYALKNNGDTILGLLVLVAVILLQLGVNLFDDYFDYKRDAGTIKKKSENDKLQKNKCKYIIEGKITHKQVLIVSLSLFFVAFLIGLLLFFKLGFWIPVLAFIGAVFCIFYPKLTYIGLGEVAVGITFGPLLFLGTYFVMTSNFSIEPVLLSIPTGLLTVGLLHTHALLDFESDMEDNKKTLCTILKTQKNALYALLVLMILAYVDVIACVYLGIFSPLYLITILTFPMCIGLYNSLNEHIKKPEKSPEKKWWMGNIDNYDALKEAGAEKFMVRFMLSRNIMIHFALLLCAAIVFS